MSLRVWLPLDGSLENRGISDIEIINNGATIDNNGKIGKCYNFNGSSYCYESTYDWSNFNTSAFSLCCWYKEPSPVASGNSQIVCIGTSSGWNNIRIGLLRSTSSGYPMFSVSDGSNAIKYNFTATSFSLDTWNHIAVTYNNGTLSMYINGILDKTENTTIIPVLNSSQHLGIGSASNGAEKLTGYLNDVRIYDHCLSQKEVKEISQGLILHYKLDMPTNNLILNGNILKDRVYWGDWRSSSTGNAQPIRSVATINEKKWLKIKTDGVTGVWVGFNQTSYENGFDINFKPNTDYTISATMYATSAINGRLWFHMRSSDGGANLSQPLQTISLTTTPTRYSYTFNSGTNDSYNINRFNFMIGISNNTADIEAYFTDIKLEEGNIASDWTPCCQEMGIDITKVPDSSGYGNDGIAMNSPSVETNKDSRYGVCTTFNGKNTYINAGNNVKPRDALTVAWWGYMDDWSQFSKICSCTQAGGWNINYNSAKHMQFMHGTGGSSNTYKYLAFGTALADLASGWHHFVVSYDGLESKAYLDGVLDGSATDFSTKTLLFYHASNSLLIGAEVGTGVLPEGSDYFNGKLSDFRIYATALSAEDVATLYHTSAQVDDLGSFHGFELKEESGNQFATEEIIKNSATSVEWDSENKRYIITSPVGTSSWGYGFKIKGDVEDNRKIIPWGKTSIFTFEVYSPIATIGATDYNNYAIDNSQTGGNDNDGARGTANFDIPANIWTLCTLSLTNNNSTKNPNQVALYDCSTFGLRTNGVSEPLVWYVRNPQWYLVETEKFQVEQNGVFITNFIKEDDLKDYVSFRDNEKAAWANNFIEK